jgi:hypothetical protein
VPRPWHRARLRPGTAGNGSRQTLTVTSAHAAHPARAADDGSRAEDAPEPGVSFESRALAVEPAGVEPVAASQAPCARYYYWPTLYVCHPAAVVTRTVTPSPARVSRIDINIYRGYNILGVRGRSTGAAADHYPLPTWKSSCIVHRQLTQPPYATSAIRPAPDADGPADRL